MQLVLLPVDIAQRFRQRVDRFCRVVSVQPCRVVMRLAFMSRVASLALPRVRVAVLAVPCAVLARHLLRCRRIERSHLVEILLADEAAVLFVKHYVAHHVCRVRVVLSAHVARDQAEHFRIVRRIRHQRVDQIADVAAQRALRKVEVLFNVRPLLLCVVLLQDRLVQIVAHRAVRRIPSVDAVLLHDLQIRERRDLAFFILRPRSVRPQHARVGEVFLQLILQRLQTVVREVVLIRVRIVRAKLVFIAQLRAPCRVKVLLEQVHKLDLLRRRIQILSVVRVLQHKVVIPFRDLRDDPVQFRLARLAQQRLRAAPQYALYLVVQRFLAAVRRRYVHVAAVSASVDQIKQLIHRFRRVRTFLHFLEHAARTEVVDRVVPDLPCVESEQQEQCVRLADHIVRAHQTVEAVAARLARRILRRHRFLAVAERLRQPARRAFVHRVAHFSVRRRRTCRADRFLIQIRVAQLQARQNAACRRRRAHRRRKPVLQIVERIVVLVRLRKDAPLRVLRAGIQHQIRCDLQIRVVHILHGLRREVVACRVAVPRVGIRERSRRPRVFPVVRIVRRIDLDRARTVRLVRRVLRRHCRQHRAHRRVRTDVAHLRRKHVRLRLFRLFLFVDLRKRHICRLECRELLFQCLVVRTPDHVQRHFIQTRYILHRRRRVQYVVRYAVDVQRHAEFQHPVRRRRLIERPAQSEPQLFAVVQIEVRPCADVIVARIRAVQRHLCIRALRQRVFVPDVQPCPVFRQACRDDVSLIVSVRIVHDAVFLRRPIRSHVHRVGIFAVVFQRERVARIVFVAVDAVDPAVELIARVIVIQYAFVRDRHGAAVCHVFHFAAHAVAHVRLVDQRVVPRRPLRRQRHVRAAHIVRPCARGSDCSRNRAALRDRAAAARQAHRPSAERVPFARLAADRRGGVAHHRQRRHIRNIGLFRVVIRARLRHVPVLKVQNASDRTAVRVDRHRVRILRPLRVRRHVRRDRAAAARAVDRAADLPAREVVSVAIERVRKRRVRVRPRRLRLRVHLLRHARRRRRRQRFGTLHIRVVCDRQCSLVSAVVLRVRRDRVVLRRRRSRVRRLAGRPAQRRPAAVSSLRRRFDHAACRAVVNVHARRLAARAVRERARQRLLPDRVQRLRSVRADAVFAEPAVHRRRADVGTRARDRSVRRARVRGPSAEHPAALYACRRRAVCARRVIIQRLVLRRRRRDAVHVVRQREALLLPIRRQNAFFRRRDRYRSARFKRHAVVVLPALERVARLHRRQRPCLVVRVRRAVRARVRHLLRLVAVARRKAVACRDRAARRDERQRDHVGCPVRVDRRVIRLIPVVRARSVRVVIFRARSVRLRVVAAECIACSRRHRHAARRHRHAVCRRDARRARRAALSVQRHRVLVALPVRVVAPVARAAVRDHHRHRLARQIAARPALERPARRRRVVQRDVAAFDRVRRRVRRSARQRADAVVVCQIVYRR